MRRLRAVGFWFRILESAIVSLGFQVSAIAKRFFGLVCICKSMLADILHEGRHTDP